MGSGISRMGGQRPPQAAAAAQAMHRPRLTLASLLCGTSFDDDPSQLEDQLDDSSSTTLESPARVGDSFMNDNLQGLTKGSSSTISSESIRSGQTVHQSHSGHHEGVSTEFSSRNIEASLSGKHLLKSKEVVLQRNAEPSSRGPAEQASSSTKPVPSGPLSISRDANLSPVAGECSKNDNDCQTNADRSITSNMPHQEVRNLPANNTPVGNRVGVIVGTHGSSEDSSSASSDQSGTQNTSEEESDEVLAALDPGLFIPVRARQRRSGSILHVDIVSISSNVFSRSSGDTENHEARRNSRRLFWDAFSRRSSERDDDSSSILFSTEENDELASHDRWLFNLSSDFFGNDGEDSEYHSRRTAAERRWRSRSEIREGLRDGLDVRSGRPTLCASGLHPDGTCSCEAFLLAEGSGTRASISRIVMLAEALFEVLDEIHRQPVPLSLSMVSRPAPESVVDSFPLKIHRESSMAGSGDVEQCYICLAEYEEGDRIRVLPCRHEYHMLCVDKWLKEIHGVCPLCRGDVCNAAADHPTPIS